MQYYELVNAERFVRVGHFTVDELMQAESEGYRILKDKPQHQRKKRKGKKPLMRKHSEIDWTVFDRLGG